MIRFLNRGLPEVYCLYNPIDCTKTLTYVRFMQISDKRISYRNPSRSRGSVPNNNLPHMCLRTGNPKCQRNSGEISEVLIQFELPKITDRYVWLVKLDAG